MTNFGTRGVFFKNWAPSLFFEHNDETVCKVSKKSLWRILRRAAYRPNTLPGVFLKYLVLFIWSLN